MTTVTAKRRGGGLAGSRTGNIVRRTYLKSPTPATAPENAGKGISPYGTITTQAGVTLPRVPCLERPIP